MKPEEVERVIGSVSEKDVMDFARRKLWDQDVAVSAVGSIEGYVVFCYFGTNVLDYLTNNKLQAFGLQSYKERYEQECLEDLIHLNLYYRCTLTRSQGTTLMQPDHQ